MLSAKLEQELKPLLKRFELEADRINDAVQKKVNALIDQLREEDIPDAYFFSDMGVNGIAGGKTERRVSPLERAWERAVYDSVPNLDEDDEEDQLTAKLIEKYHHRFVEISELIQWLNDYVHRSVDQYPPEKA